MHRGHRHSDDSRQAERDEGSRNRYGRVDEPDRSDREHERRVERSGEQSPGQSLGEEGAFDREPIEDVRGETRFRRHGGQRHEEDGRGSERGGSRFPVGRGRSSGQRRGPGPEQGSSAWGGWGRSPSGSSFGGGARGYGPGYGRPGYGGSMSGGGLFGSSTYGSSMSSGPGSGGYGATMGGGESGEFGTTSGGWERSGGREGERRGWEGERGAWGRTGGERPHDPWTPGGGYEGGRSGWGAGGASTTQEQREWGGPFRGLGPKGYRRSDERLKEECSECLTDDPRVDATEIEVEVHDAEVTLTGTVADRRQKRFAEDCCEQVTGVEEVHNLIRVLRAPSGERPGGTRPSSQRSSGSPISDT